MATQAKNSSRLGLDPQSRGMLRRFVFVLAIMVVWAVVVSPQYPLSALLLMTTIATALDGLVALLRRDRFNAAALNFWDSTCGFLAISCLARGLTHGG